MALRFHCAKVWAIAAAVSGAPGERGAAGGVNMGGKPAGRVGVHHGRVRLSGGVRGRL